jgi:hypothetical protein
LYLFYFQEGEQKEELQWFENILENLFEEVDDKIDGSSDSVTTTPKSGGMKLSAGGIQKTLKNASVAKPDVDIDIEVNVFDVR